MTQEQAHWIGIGYRARHTSSASKRNINNPICASWLLDTLLVRQWYWQCEICMSEQLCPVQPICTRNKAPLPA